jgi:hypothetical protein
MRWGRYWAGVGSRPGGETASEGAGRGFGGANWRLVWWLLGPEEPDHSENVAPLGAIHSENVAPLGVREGVWWGSAGIKLGETDNQLPF